MSVNANYAQGGPERMYRQIETILRQTRYTDLSAAQIEEYTGNCRTTVRRYLKELVSEGKVERTRTVCQAPLYALAEQCSGENPQFRVVST